MIIIGVDFHPEFQQIALLNTTTGEVEEKRLAHPDEAEKFYRALASANETVRIGMEASGHARWFERLVAELQFELWIGDAAAIRAKRGRKQKTDRQDAQLILSLLLEDRFPKIWVPSSENRDLRQLLWHRHRMVQARTRVMNQLQAVALNEGLHCKKKLWRERGRQQLESFALAPWASRRRRDLLELLDRLNPVDCGPDAGHRTRSRELSGGAAAQNTPWSGRANGAGVCAHTRRRGTLSLRQAGGELSGTGAAGRVQRESPAPGTHHQAGQFDRALPAGGGGAGHGAQPAGVAQQIFSSGAAARTQDCESRDGSSLGRAVVLDDAQAMGLRAAEKVRFARGTARTSPWCAVEHRVIDWASRSSSDEEFEVVIMIAVSDRRDAWVGPKVRT